MSDFERYQSNSEDRLYALSELETLKSNSMRTPRIDDQGNYVILTKTNAWIMKMDKFGYIYINPKHLGDWQISYFITEYMTRLFGLNIYFLYRYRKHRMYIKPDHEYVSYRWFHKGEGYFRYVYDGAQTEPIIMDLRGGVVSGARSYTSGGDYVSVW